MKNGLMKERDEIGTCGQVIPEAIECAGEE
jgi:hypothetical protein